MKKIFVWMLSIALCASLCSCGGSLDKGTTENQAQTKDQNGNDSSAYLGDWVYDTGKGNVITFHFNKGGTGYYEQSTKADSKYEYSWEVKDGVLVATRQALGTTFTSVFEFNNDGTLSRSYFGEKTGPYIKQ